MGAGPVAKLTGRARQVCEFHGADPAGRQSVMPRTSLVQTRFMLEELILKLCVHFSSTSYGIFMGVKGLNQKYRKSSSFMGGYLLPYSSRCTKSTQNPKVLRVNIFLIAKYYRQSYIMNLDAQL
jgi:hypothetical protein